MSLEQSVALNSVLALGNWNCEEDKVSASMMSVFLKLRLKSRVVVLQAAGEKQSTVSTLLGLQTRTHSSRLRATSSFLDLRTLNSVCAISFAALVKQRQLKKVQATILSLKRL